MEKSPRVLIFAALVLLLLIGNFIVSFFGNSNIKAIQTNITMSQRNLDSALANIRFSKSKLDVIQSDIGKTQDSIKNMQTDVDKMNLNKDVSDAKSTARLKELFNKVSVLKQDVVDNDTPPVILIKPL